MNGFWSGKSFFGGIGSSKLAAEWEEMELSEDEILFGEEEDEGMEESCYLSGGDSWVKVSGGVKSAVGYDYGGNGKMRGGEQTLGNGRDGKSPFAAKNDRKISFAAKNGDLDGSFYNIDCVTLTSLKIGDEDGLYGSPVQFLSTAKPFQKIRGFNVEGDASKPLLSKPVGGLSKIFQAETRDKATSSRGEVSDIEADNYMNDCVLPRTHPKSAPMNVPDWSKILGPACSQCFFRPRGANFNWDDEEDNDEMLPPHELVDRQKKAEKSLASSMGLGFRLDWKISTFGRVRDEILRLTGYFW